MARADLGSQVTELSAEPAFPFELEALSKAENYQRWIFRTVAPFLGDRILELGAGIGNMSKWLPLRERLILTETDPALFSLLASDVERRFDGDLRVKVDKLDLTGGDLSAYIAENLDTIVSFNVLEHIEDDHLALRKLCEILKNSNPGKPRRLVTFVPAHHWAFGSMDATFGHHRRYSKRALKTLCQEIAPEAKLLTRHFNVVGLGGWILNGRILKKKNIGLGSIQAFEKLCPWISGADDFIHRTLKLPIGQSLLFVLEWR
jgi:SAM-dependent methyltransferase